jgi:transcriptional regulator with GAF, ATPase, and Fis domain
MAPSSTPANGNHGSAQGQPSAEDQGTATAQDLGQHLSELARSLQAEDDVDQILDEVVQTAVQLVPGVEEGSISVVTGRASVASQSASSDLPRQVDALQSEVSQGPCLDAVFEQQTVRVPDMASEQRWPEFARRAAALGAASMLSFQLYVEGDNLGALNLYARTAGAFTDESEQIGLLVASHAAVAFADARKLDHAKAAMATRDLIGQAKGILMERHKITAYQAFRVLSQASQTTNRRLYDLAVELTRTGLLAEPGDGNDQDPTGERNTGVVRAN